MITKNVDIGADTDIEIKCRSRKRSSSSISEPSFYKKGPRYNLWHGGPECLN